MWRLLALALLLGLFLPAQEATDTTAPDYQQLVAPVALYPDQLLSDVLAAATYPDQVNAAEVWMRQNSGLGSDQVADAVNGFDWDDSVKALTAFPEVLAYLDQNLSWTSALGDAYYNDPDGVMAAVQTLRQRALADGTLRSNGQVSVSNQDGLIVISPASTDTYYVPMYDPWSFYGFGISPWPDWGYPAGFAVGGGLNWGFSFHWGGHWGNFNWGLPHWGFDWGNHRPVYQGKTWVSRSPVMIRRPIPTRGTPPPATRGTPPVRGNPPEAKATTPPVARKVAPAPGRPAQTYPAQKPPQTRTAPPQPAPKPATKAPSPARGFPQAKPAAPPTGTRSSAFSGFNRGSAAAGNASRGAASMGAPRAAAPPAAGGRGRGHV